MPLLPVPIEVIKFPFLASGKTPFDGHTAPPVPYWSEKDLGPILNKIFQVFDHIALPENNGLRSFRLSFHFGLMV
jgi:hypothetical protein